MLLTANRAAQGSVPVQVQPIAPSDVPRVAEFLHRHLNGQVTADVWARAMNVSWVVGKPNSGFMLLDDNTVVGAHLAFYSQRDLGGDPERVCNLGAWCVLPEHRFHSLRLLRALLGQRDYSFTDLSPSGNVVPLNERLGFEILDTATASCRTSRGRPTRARRNQLRSRLIERILKGQTFGSTATTPRRRRPDTSFSTGTGVVLRGIPKGPAKGATAVRLDPAHQQSRLLRPMARPFARHLLIHRAP